MKSTAAVSPRRSICPRSSVVGSSGTWATRRRPKCRGVYPVVWRVSTRSLSAGAVVPGQRRPHRWLSTAPASSMRTLFPGARLGNCLRHALNKLPEQTDRRIASPVRKALALPSSTPCCTGARQRKGLRVFALGQRLRRFADHVAHHGWRSQWRARATVVPGQESGLVCGACRPADAGHASTLLDQAHNAIDRKLFAMKGFHHPRGSQAGVSHRARAPLQPDPVSAPRPACGPMWGGSGRRARPDIRM